MTRAGRYNAVAASLSLNGSDHRHTTEIWPPAADRTQPTEAELAELSALADGTLDPARRESVQARIAASPELTALFEREQRVVQALHQARATERAPARLRTRIEAARPSRATATRRRFAYGGAVAVALAAIVLALVLALPSGAPGGPSVSDAAALAARGPTQTAPVPDPDNPRARLYQGVGDNYLFPNWTARFGWNASGARTDTLNGRTAVTVYYEREGMTIAYTIVHVAAARRAVGEADLAERHRVPDAHAERAEGGYLAPRRRHVRAIRDRGHGRRPAEAGGVEGPGGS